jgi:hypothetical protein
VDLKPVEMEGQCRDKGSYEGGPSGIDFESGQMQRMKTRKYRQQHQQAGHDACETQFVENP